MPAVINPSVFSKQHGPRGCLGNGNNNGSRSNKSFQVDYVNGFNQLSIGSKDSKKMSSSIQNGIPTTVTSETTCGNNDSSSSTNTTAPPKGSEIFVDRVPNDCTEGELRAIFETIGPISDFRLMCNSKVSTRSFLFVRYTTRENAKQAVRDFNNYEIRPHKTFAVSLSVDNRKLWISGIPRNCSSKDIRDAIGQLTEGLRDVILYPSQVDKTRSRGYAFVEYDSHKAAAAARRKLVAHPVSLLGQVVDKVDWAEPETEVDEEVMATVKVLFIRNLMPETTEEDIRRQFEEFSENCGAVERVKKLKDYAFVHFRSRDKAEMALNAAENLVMHDSKIEVVWSKPVDKQVYKIRKHLTKVLSSPNPENFQNPVFPFGSPAIDAMSSLQCRGPRRRGAAGIKGLGGPGTLPFHYRKLATASSETEPDKLYRSLMGTRTGYPVMLSDYYPPTPKNWPEGNQFYIPESDENASARQLCPPAYLVAQGISVAHFIAANPGVNPSAFFTPPYGPNGFIVPPSCLSLAGAPVVASSEATSTGSPENVQQLSDNLAAVAI